MLVLMPTLERSTQAGEKRAVWGPRCGTQNLGLPATAKLVHPNKPKAGLLGRRSCPSRGRVEVRVFQPFSTTLASGGGIQDLKKRAGSANGMLNIGRLSGRGQEFHFELSYLGEGCVNRLQLRTRLAVG